MYLAGAVAILSLAWTDPAGAAHSAALRVPPGPVMAGDKELLEQCRWLRDAAVEALRRSGALSHGHWSCAVEREQ